MSLAKTLNTDVTESRIPAIGQKKIDTSQDDQLQFCAFNGPRSAVTTPLKALRPLVLVVGAGPAGIYASAKFAEAGLEVVLINRDLKPGGLAEYGIYFNKYRMKEGIRKQFRKTLSDSHVHYFGHVRIGEQANLKLCELRELLKPSAVFITTGAQGTKFLGIPGERAPRVYHAKDLVYHYNNLPPFSEREFPIGERVAIIGIGNVMVDIAHYLVHERRVADVIAIARRGPQQRAYTDLEIKAIAANFDRQALRQELERVAPRLGVPNPDIDGIYQELLKYSELPAKEGESPSRMTFRYLSSPKEVLLHANGFPRAMRVEDTELARKGQDFSARGLGTYTEIPADTVVFAVGDRVDESLGLPVQGTEYITNPNPDQEFPGDEAYQAFDPARNERLEGVFVAGWSRKASDGLVGKAKQDGERGVTAVLHYLGNLGRKSPINAAGQAAPAVLRDALAQRGIQFVEYSEVQQLEEIERRVAEDRGIEFFKYSTNAEMLRAIRAVSAAPG